ncbi:DUF4293 domain-containing protein [Carboxylicivirga mesophila]|uniref:DUF4293 domain-containing protein n=1 Tax=Carboxylicivirga mesophila TaxID=1166478 RepID=A0ABS5KFI1_9BACT|nr:DUF4293 domain-containing protein [Carboxylicivirga mesophila]MBS2213745.1 DUF4293 domain-containing protein [Carboxylicivirga mesophila]
MLQRIQTVYLLLSGLLMTSLFFLPFAQIEAESGEVYNFMYRGLTNADGETVIPTLALAILLTAATIVAFITIFLFKKRVLQIRLCGLNLALLLGSTGMIYYLGTQLIDEITGVMSYKIMTAFPLVALILTFLALRAIGKDIALLKSMDRIR